MVTGCVATHGLKEHGGKRYIGSSVGVVQRKINVKEKGGRLMPYVREKIKKMLDQKPSALSPGELNYLITSLCLRYLRHPANCGGRYNYRRINDVVGVLECAKQEFYRRIAVPYEDDKIKENGDVY
jgi:hypothetical protein